MIMQITQPKPNLYEIKTKEATIHLDDAIKINDVILSGPGEYEVADVMATGQSSGIFIFESEDLTVCFLDHLKEPPSDDQLEKINDTDILLIPVGKDTLSVSAAVKTISQIEPKIAIPVFCHELEELAKEGGWPKKEESTLKVAKKNLISENTQLVIIKW